MDLEWTWTGSGSGPELDNNFPCKVLYDDWTIVIIMVFLTVDLTVSCRIL